MSLWSSVTNLVANGMYEMKSFYDRKGMYDIRVNYALWIEERLGCKRSDKIEEAAILFVNDLKEHIRLTEDHQTFTVITSRMGQITELEFYTHLIDGMAKEVLLVGEITPSNEMPQLEFIQSLIKSCNEFYQIPNLSLDGEIDPNQMNELNDPVSYLTKIFQGYDLSQRSVFDELKNWQRQQIRICNVDVPQKDNSNQIQNNVQINKLNQIQNCIELLVEVTFRLLQLIDSVRMRRMRNSALPDERLEQLAQEIRIKQENLMIDSFIVDNQPNQVIKTNTNFTASVRWLIGPQLGLNNSISNVECIVVPEDQARHLNKGQKINQAINASSKEIRGNEVKMEYQEQNRVYSANFKALQIKKIQRAERRGSSESVMDEKLALLFRMTVVVNNSSFTVSTLSPPVVVIVHGNQEHQACATIMWDNAFSEIGRDLFVVPDRVSWTKLSEALYLKCFSETKRGFTDANRYFLYEKFFPNHNMIPEVEISWTKFCKDELTGFPFTFWEWFYYTIKLIKERLLEPWNADLIEGFISKKATTEKLQSRPPGTFLLRFSDSIKGAITISYVNEYNQVDHIQPWNSKDLQNRCLADRIRDLVVLERLYPHEIPKSYLFDRFCSIDDQKVNVGYVPGVPITTILRTPPAAATTPTLLENMLQEKPMAIEEMLIE
ncbi:signal transducer and transcription activator-like isoform X2 [Episyrphus balteatus]|uniref:signal transducer and transcription activator-like isoform X2 n=1 Tax=Episyrphus balteatus TaxID=286459 RepID=UPI002486AF8D|nr:signal transducer and transcription activator-like isoform X2 [Episyrphus balteatus]